MNSKFHIAQNNSRPSQVDTMREPPQRNMSPTRNSAPSAVKRNSIPQNPTISATNPSGLFSSFSSFKGGAGSLFKNLKDTSSKVIQSVQQTMVRTDLDISAITSRIIVMPCPSEGLESAYKINNIEDVKQYVESHFPLGKVSVYNVGARSVRLPPPVRTVEGSFLFPLANKAPLLQGIYSIVEDMFGFLSADPKSVIIVQSPDGGRAMAASVVCALLVYANFVQEPEDAIQIFAVKRLPPDMDPSEIRYLYYLADVSRTTPHLPHFKPVTITSLTCSPIPRMTKARDGCRLYVEIACHDKILSSTVQEYEKMR